jgi:hypothetical protein
VIDEKGFPENACLCLLEGFPSSGRLLMKRQRVYILGLGPETEQRLILTRGLMTLNIRGGIDDEIKRFGFNGDRDFNDSFCFFWGKLGGTANSIVCRRRSRRLVV